MRTLCMVIAYDGSGYHGFQIQPDVITIQQVLQQTLHELTGEEIHVSGSGRTDAGVHARRQVIHFKTNSPIPIERWTRIMNGRLPDDIVVLQTCEVPDHFHARKSARSKTYRYSIRNGPIPDVFKRKYEWHVPQPLDWTGMEKGLKHLVGEHDFTSFSSSRTDKEDRVRTVYAAWIEREPHDPELYHIYLTGNGFLYNMVRIIVGTLLEVGRGVRSSDDIAKILAARNRTCAGPTAPPQGLTLWEVQYERDLQDLSPETTQNC